MIASDAFSCVRGSGAEEDSLVRGVVKARGARWVEEWLFWGRGFQREPGTRDPEESFLFWGEEVIGR